MIRQLSPDQIAKRWEYLAPRIEAAMPPYAIGAVGEARRANWLRMMIQGRMQCWAGLGVDKRTGAPTIAYIMTTTFSTDECTGIRNLEVYTLYGEERLIPDEMWTEGFTALRGFALSKGCHRIVAFSSIGRVIDRWRTAGGDDEYHFLTMKVQHA